MAKNILLAVLIGGILAIGVISIWQGLFVKPAKPEVRPTAIETGRVQSWCESANPVVCAIEQFEEEEYAYWITYTRTGSTRVAIHVPVGFVGVTTDKFGEHLIEGPVDVTYAEGAGPGEKVRFMRLGTYLVLRYK